MCLWFFEIKFRYSEICKKWTIQCFDKCVIYTPMPICHGQFELNTVLVCYMLTLKCPYPAKGNCTINWALWKIPSTCLTLIFPPTPWKTSSDAYLETTDSRYHAGLLKVSALEAWVRISALQLTGYLTWGKVCILPMPQFPHLQNADKNRAQLTRLFCVVRADCVKTMWGISLGHCLWNSKHSGHADSSPRA